MSEHKADVKWERRTNDFNYDSYNRGHSIIFNDEISIQGSAAAEFKGDPHCANPEQVLTAALSSCHLLTFLAIAAKKRYTVEEYHDEAIGFLEKGEEGRLVVSRAVLQPRAKFSGGKIPSKEELEKLHDSAHKHCAIANSVTTKVEIKIRYF
ncbi:MAG: OsmC family protein [Candidatus Omnitrophica bacterium]|nr:OsmC family protein [Candidatus Omnitrophota bacterium]